MSIEVAGTILAGVMAGSLALIAFGADSSVELVSGVAVIRHLRADHKGVETGGRRTALLTTGLLFALVPVVGGLALYSYFSGIRPEGSPLGIGLAVGAVVLMPILFLEKRRIGREARCLPISIDAYASATCLLLSVAHPALRDSESFPFNQRSRRRKQLNRKTRRCLKVCKNCNRW
ncbi:MAG: hypothetical protein HY297_03260 [Thaumarchaeota archaeon]|nr:hypothetical protein [Nitrososphaerota archaeon]